jgi:hypothetical protein
MMLQKPDAQKCARSFIQIRHVGIPQQPGWSAAESGFSSIRMFSPQAHEVSVLRQVRTMGDKKGGRVF